MSNEGGSLIREGMTSSPSSSSHQSSSHPSPRQRKLDEFMKPGWLRAHKKTVTSSLSQHHELILISDSSPRPIHLADDLGSICPAEGMGEDAEKLNDHFYLFRSRRGMPF